ncbi:hypothetical protein OEZ85_005568 [Tetradesmus obliquus]|uniref:non-specific serine/threonine protein kinase n=1 Tax=Tetradesmus obliquus TaxID=3088 RepID=A0ABY8UDR0_TETOB|nr:hypothetical protein OEZ85_005568 [Tetradesmus obliquus]
MQRQCCPLRPAVAFLTSGDHNADAVETDPSQRYLRYPVLLGRGACKRVYKAFDQVEGIEVAWNQVDLGSHMDQESRERLFSEIHVLKSLKHRNIMSFFDWWYDGSSQTINFITEYFTSGNLRQYRKKHKLISEQAIKRWAFQILEGLLYLHAHDPPIVHRDLKCDNILVNGTSGQVKIADLGLASCQRGLSVVGTPEFMAPEIYDEVYDEKVDIYSFGMCMLELATLEYPYSECRSVPAIFRKVSQGIPPAALSKVSSQSLRDFVTLCINPNPVKRPSALDLLKHEFFDSLKLDASNMGSPTHAAKGGCFGLPFGSCGNLQALGSSHASSSHARTLGKSKTANDSGEDSDDEVLVSLEDVLAPHPEDLLDPETYHLHSQLTHAGSGCMVMSHAGCPIAAGADMPLESRLSGFQGLVARPDASGVSVTGSDALAGMLSRYASSVAAQHQQLQHMLQMQQQQQPQQQQLQQQHSLQGALALAVAGAQCAESPRQLLRTLSNSNHMRNAGALAAAGLLQMSPGLYLTTPPLLGKLLSKKARNFQGMGSAAAAAGPQCHHGRGPSHDSLASWEFSQLSVSSAAVEQLQQLDASGACLTERSRAGSWDATGQPGSAGSVWPIKPEHGKGTGALSSWGVDEDAAAAPLAAVYGDPAAATRPAAVQLSSDAVAATPLLSPAAARLAAADAVFSSSMGSSPAAGASPVCGMPGGFGKILVRRRFARNLHPVALTIKRSASV